MAIDSSCRTKARSARRPLAGAVFLVACCAAPAAADLWVKEKVTGADGTALGERTWTFGGGRVRLETKSGGLLVDSVSGRAWRFGADGKCEAGAFPKRDAPPVASRSREQERFDELLSRLESPEIALVPTRERKTIAKVEAERHELRVSGEAVQERWLALDLDTGGLDDLLTGLIATGGSAVFSALPEGRIMASSIGRGYPVRVRDLRSGAVVEAIEVRTDAQPASAFTPPAGCPKS
jgi:hypothetical protein